MVVQTRGMTDYFQTMELKCWVMYEANHVLNQRKVSYLIVTKSVAITGPPSKRIEGIKTLQEAGFDVVIRLSSLVEEFMDFDRLSGFGIERGNRSVPAYQCVGGSGNGSQKRITVGISTGTEGTALFRWKEYMNSNKDCCNLRLNTEKETFKIGNIKKSNINYLALPQIYVFSKKL